MSSGLVVMRQVLSNYTYIWDRCVCMVVCMVCIYAGDVYTYVQCRAVKLIFLPSKKRETPKNDTKKYTLQPSPKTELMPPNYRMVQLDIGHWPLATVARSVNFWRSPTELDLACHGASLKRATASCCAALCLYHLFMNYIYLHKYLHLYTV